MRPLLVAQPVLGMSAMASDPLPPVAPDAAMIATYAEVVFGWCEGWVAVRALAEKGGPDAGHDQEDPRRGVHAQVE